MKLLLITLALALTSCLEAPSGSAPPATSNQPTLDPSIVPPLPSNGPTPSTLAEHDDAFVGVFTNTTDPTMVYNISPTTIYYSGHGREMVVAVWPTLWHWGADVACNSTLAKLSTAQGATQNDFNISMHHQSGSTTYYTNTAAYPPYAYWVEGCENPAMNWINNQSVTNWMPVHWTSDKCFDTTAVGSSTDSNPTGTFCKP